MILVGIMKIFYDIAVCVSYRVDRRKRNTLHNRKKIIKNQKRVNFVLEVDISRYKFNASDFNFKKKTALPSPRKICGTKDLVIYQRKGQSIDPYFEDETF